MNGAASASPSSTPTATAAASSARGDPTRSPAPRGSLSPPSRTACRRRLAKAATTATLRSTWSPCFHPSRPLPVRTSRNCSTTRLPPAHRLPASSPTSSPSCAPPGRSASRPSPSGRRAPAGSWRRSSASSSSTRASFRYFQSIQMSINRLSVIINLLYADAAQLSNGYLDSTVIDWVPGMPADMRLRDFPSFIRTTDADDAMLRRVLGLADCVRTVASAVVLNTFDELEGEVVEAMSAFLPPIYAVGPVPLLAQQVVVAGGGAPPLDAPPAASLTKEDDGCLAWLGTKRPRSVVYANFGSIAVLTTQQIEEFAWGLANSGYEFLMVIRDDQANGASGGGITPKFVEETKGRCYVTRWCPQVAVLRHEAVGAFLTHCGWNSMLESICSGVPMLCWPFGADQQTNCRFACMEWRVGVEVGGDVKRAEVEALVRDVMGRGEKGMELRRRAAEWKERAAAASEPDLIHHYGTPPLDLLPHLQEIH
ncbi:hypothetical protein SEVIR_1G164332v4 [Setaria viridis]|uniref:Glycosyltransferase n=1 Tax=Setaria viridis TaxID=4556 RepID=A0A4U6W968_SETVI|nr:hypothetical protein SEVIR_1G164332v2 [Setaria viridis]